jgi:hypothetical protein
MPRKITIVKTEIMIPVDKDTNEYGDILFHDEAGNEYKINQKRARLGEQIVVGRAVELGYGNYMNYDFIAEARLVEGALPPAKEPYTPPPEHPEPPAKSTSPQETGMWWKELGNRIGDGSLERDYPKAHIKIKGQYYKKMSEVTGVNFKE